MTNERLAAITRARYKQSANGTPEWTAALALTAALNGSRTPAAARRLLRWCTASTRADALALLCELGRKTRL